MRIWVFLLLLTSLTWAERFRVHHRPAEWLVRRLTDKFTELKFVVIDEVGIEVAGDGPALKRIQAELAALDQEPMEQEVMMQGLVLDRSAPLYGRAQEILRISPLGATFLRFWYRYVARHRSLLHAGQVAPVLAAIHSDFSHHVSGVWEDLVRSAIPFLNFGAQSWGLAQRWWGPGRDRKPLRHENCKEARMRIQITPEARVCPGGPKGPRMRRWIFGGLLGLSASAGLAQPLAIVEQGRPRVSVCVRPDAGPWEKAAAQDLATVVGKMTGVTLPILNTPPPADQDCIVVGELAIPALHERLQGTRRKTPILRHDAIALRSQPHRLWVAGSNDDSHYFAVAELMRRWGCRWYMPGDFGECIPPKSSLLQEPLDYAYAPPFEVRGYWLSWNGDQTGYASFAHRNFMNLERIPAGHALGPHIERVKAKLGSFETTSPEAAALVAEGLQADFSQGKSQSLSIEDATVAQLSDGEHDYNGGIRDKYFVANNMSDSYLLFYQRVARRLAAKFPHSKARLGFLAYVNLTLPPQRQLRAAAPLICYLAPIDIDPNHSDSPPKQDFFGALARWVQVMQGRVIIYDYDQSMLVWRDLPNPSQHVFQNDVKKYRKLGILGLDTESRGALATTFLNLYFRGQLMWNPDLDVDRELREFYPGFFGPAAQPMAAYWGRIYEAWKDTPVLEHEYFVIPHVYPRALVSQLKVPVAAGVREPYASRLRFAGLCQNLLDGYTRQLEAMATADYAEAARIARACLAEREKLTDMNPTFTTYRKYPESGPAFWTGEAAYLEELSRLVAGPQGRLVRTSPRRWDFRWDLDDHGLWQNWADDRSKNWETMPVDRYLLPQGGEPRTGFAWYRWRLRLTGPEAALPLHLAFPGLFNSSWLYLDGNLQASRNQQDLWWREDYRFLWDVDMSGKLHAGDNWICVRTRVPLHLAGIFQPPVVYQRLK